MDGTSQIIVTPADMLQAVRESALLADVSVGVFTAERSDRAIMEKVKRDAGATGNVGRVVKNMFAGADDKLKEVRAAFTKARSVHYELTLPWVTDPHAQRQTGPRLLPHLLLERYLTAMSKQKRIAYDLLESFLADYPDLVRQAKANLGLLADQFYPSVDEVKSAFRIHFDFEPIPESANFRGLDDHTMERLSRAMQNKQTRMIDAAQKYAWSEVRERLTYMADKLADPEARFHKSTIDKVRELATLLPGWNLTGSEQMIEATGYIDALLHGVTPDELRDNADTRTTVVNQARAIIAQLDEWGV